MNNRFRLKKEEDDTIRAKKNQHVHSFRQVTIRRHDATAYMRGVVKIILTTFVYTRDPCPFTHVTC